MKKKLATKAMLRKVKLYIENTAFDDSRILRKRGQSGIDLSPKDLIFKKRKDFQSELITIEEVDFNENNNISHA